MTASRLARLFLVPLLGTALATAQAAEPAAKPAAKPAAAKAAGAKQGELPADVTDAMGKLVEAAIQQAGAELVKGGDKGFQPYGVLKLASGELRLVQWGKPEKPPAEEIAAHIIMALRSAAAQPEVDAAVLVSPTKAPTTDGKQEVAMIRADVDHRRGEPRIVLIPYAFEDGKLVPGTLIYMPGQAPLFMRKGNPAKAPAAPSTSAKKP